KLLEPRAQLPHRLLIVNGDALNRAIDIAPKRLDRNQRRTPKLPRPSLRLHAPRPNHLRDIARLRLKNPRRRQPDPLLERPEHLIAPLVAHEVRAALIQHQLPHPRDARKRRRPVPGAQTRQQLDQSRCHALDSRAHATPSAKRPRSPPYSSYARSTF